MTLRSTTFILNIFRYGVKGGELGS